MKAYVCHNVFDPSLFVFPQATLNERRSHWTNTVRFELAPNTYDIANIASPR